MISSCLPGGWTLRPATMDDVQSAVDLCNARSQTFYGENQSTLQDIRSWWTSPRFHLADDLRLAVDSDGALAGMTHVNDPGEPYAGIGCAVIVSPAYEDQLALWDTLHAWALARIEEYVPRAAAEIRVAAHTSAYAGDGARQAAIERAGFQLVRVDNRMRIEMSERPPTPTWSEGIAVRTADVEQELRAIVAADVEAFRDHWGYVERPFDKEVEGWQEFIDGEGDLHDPTLWFLAVDGQEVAGIAICRGHIADDETRGYVGSLAVRPAWRRRGIGLALLHHALGEFYRRGQTTVELDMDSENLTGALRLYERAGMHVVRQGLSYEKELRPGIDVVTRELVG